MLLPIITALACFAAAMIMFSSYYRKMSLLRPMGVYLIFEGAMVMLNYVLTDIYPTTAIPHYIQCIGTLLIVLYYIFILVMTKSKSRRKQKRSSQRQGDK